MMQQRVLVSIWLILALVACGPIAAPAKPAPLPSTPLASATPAQAEPRATFSIARASPSAEPQPTLTLAPAATPELAAHMLIVTNSAGRAVSIVDPRVGTVTQIDVGTAPWGLALAPKQMAYVATAEGVAVVDIRRRERVALIPYQAKVGQPTFGEYRPGGMGIAVAPDGARIYVGVFLPDRSGRLEVIDASKRAVIASLPIGVRPFQVLASPDGRMIYTIDHDTFTVTAIDTTTYIARTLPVEPLGNSGWGSWDKPHYAAMRADGHLLLPIQGRVLVDLDPTSGKSVALPLQANTHQHGAALTPDGRRLLIVGTGPAGDAQGPPRLTVLDLVTMSEDDIPLSRPHEQVALSPDGRLAYVTGGHSFANAGWDGISVVDIQRRSVTELAVPDRPLDIVVFSLEALGGENE